MLKDIINLINLYKMGMKYYSSLKILKCFNYFMIK